MNEIWKDIKGYEGLYQVSNLGRVKSLNYLRTGKEQILKLNLEKWGYYTVKLSNGTPKWFKVHRLVAQSFIPNPGQVIMFRNLSAVQWSVPCTYTIKGGGTRNVTCYPKIQLKLYSNRIWMAGGPITALNQSATQSNIDSTNILYNFIEY